MTLTFNLEELYKNHDKAIDYNELFKIYKKPAERWQNFIKPLDREKMMGLNFKTTSSEIFKFLEEKLGIEVDREFNNHRRNQINTMIRKVASTQKGKRTTLNYYQFRDLLLLEEFNKFVLNNFGEMNVAEEEMYEEIMYLQQNKFKETVLYEAQRQEDFQTIAYVLELIPNLGNILKKEYCLLLEVIERGDYYGDLPLEDNQLELLDVISYRFRQTSRLIYRYDSKEDVYSTNDEKLFEWFIQDIIRWANEEIYESPLDKQSK